MLGSEVSMGLRIGIAVLTSFLLLCQNRNSPRRFHANPNSHSANYRSTVMKRFRTLVTQSGNCLWETQDPLIFIGELRKGGIAI
jgi:hypothetical protein